MHRVWISRILALYAVMACATALSASQAASGQPFPRLPKMVWELYLPEEYEACGVVYGVYARLPEAKRAKLHAGAKTTLDAGALTPDQTRALAAWFNSAHWGCDPPAETLSAEAVSKSTLVLTHETDVIELALRSPRKGIWKKLVIACAPQKAEWVRDGLPLLPAWIRPGWKGGTHPPKLPEGPSGGLGLMVRGLYRGYAGLDPSRLRELHRGGLARVDFRTLDPRTQGALSSVVDADRLSRNKSFGKPLDQGRPPAARRRHFGITTVVLEYRRTHPNCPYSAPFGTDMYTCPRPYKQVYLTLDASYPAPPKQGGKFDRWDPSPTYLVAMPAPLQTMVLDWQRACADWEARWRYKQGGQQYQKADAPPYPRFPLTR